MSNRRNHRRLKPRIRRRAAPGTRPGTLNVAADAVPTTIDIIAYDKDRILEQRVDNPQDLKKLVNQWPVVWVDVVGLGSEQTLKALAELFHIHPLAMEDVVNVHQRAKADQYDQNVYIVLRMPNTTREQCTEQLSIFLGKNFVVTIQEGPGDCFNLVRNRLRLEQSMMRQETQADYLTYRLIDAVVDGYFPVFERIGDRLDELDDRTAGPDGQAAFTELHSVRRELLMLRRAVWPLRDAINEIRNEATPYISDQTRIYLRDCYDHSVQLIDLMESYREICGDIRDFYLSSISNRMNQVMKTLTIIATIFMPLSFIAGLYGMNFNTESPWNMPELNWRYGYPFALGLMAFVAIGMLINFKQRGWLDRAPTVDDPLTEPDPPTKKPGH